MYTWYADQHCKLSKHINELCSIIRKFWKFSCHHRYSESYLGMVFENNQRTNCNTCIGNGEMRMMTGVSQGREQISAKRWQWHWHFHIDGLVQERRHSIANALVLRLSCTNRSICAMATVISVVCTMQMSFAYMLKPLENKFVCAKLALSLVILSKLLTTVD